MTEEKEKSLKFRIAEFAKMVGVEPSTVRYYEKHGFPGNRRDENGYRVFDERDAFRMNNFRSIYAQGFSIKEALRMMEEPSRKEVIRGLQENCRDMERELLLLAARKRWAEETLRLMELREEGAPMLWRLELPDFYYLPACVQRDFTITQENWETRNVWEDWLGVTRFVGIVDGQRFCRGEAVLIDLGEAVPAPDLEAYGYPVDRTVRRLPMGDCLCFYSSGRTQPYLSLGNHPEVEEYLKKNALAAGGEILNFFLMLYAQEEGNGASIVVLPVRKK